MATVAGLSASEALDMPPGVVFDVFELYRRTLPNRDGETE